MQCLAICAALAHAITANAEGGPAGEFDYYVLALSWQANWCAREGDARNAPECEIRTGQGWTLHGLWPQHEHGWPSFCSTAKRPPTRSMTRDMTDIMGSAGLAWHQWRKHGTCSGLGAGDYFALSRLAYDRIAKPDVFRKLRKPVRLPAQVVEDAFLKANPDVTDDMLTVTCRAGWIAEVRVCLTRKMTPRTCGPDVQKECRLDDARFDPMR
ncbi:MAG: ribonuclease T2 [Pseudomonadota bacterium]